MINIACYHIINNINRYKHETQIIEKGIIDTINYYLVLDYVLKYYYETDNILLYIELLLTSLIITFTTFKFIIVNYYEIKNVDDKILVYYEYSTHLMVLIIYYLYLRIWFLNLLIAIIYKMYQFNNNYNKDQIEVIKQFKFKIF